MAGGLGGLPSLFRRLTRGFAGLAEHLVLVENRFECLALFIAEMTRFFGELPELLGGDSRRLGRRAVLLG